MGDPYLDFVEGDVIEADDIKIPMQNMEQGQAWYGAATLTPAATDDYAVTVNEGVEDYLPTLQAGLMVHLKLPNSANTQAATLSVNGTTAKDIKKKGTTALVGGELPANAMVFLLYDGTNFQIVGGPGSILAQDLPGGIDAAKIGAGSVDNTEFGYLDGVSGAIQDQLDGKAPTARTVTAGTGLSGGGDLSANRTLDLDITDMTAETTVNDADLVAVWDDSASAMRKMTRANFLSGVGTLDGSGSTGQVAVWADSDTLTGVAQGSGGALDADTLDGQHASAFAAASHTSAAVTDFAEAAQDAVGAMVADTATIDVTYTDATPELTWDVKDGSITYAKMQDVTATDKLLGRSTAGSGDVEEISCTSAGRALLDDADAAAQRSTLGLGSAATQDSSAFAAASHNHPLAQGATDVTAIASELNLLDLAGLTAGQVLRASGTAAAAWAALQAGDLPGGIDASKIGSGSVNNTEFGYLDGVTGAIQTQLDARAPLASPALTGTPTAPTAGAGTNTTQIATTAFVQAAAGAITNHSVSGTLYVAAAGSSGAFTGNTTPSYTAYTTGDIILMKANHSPSGSTTLNLNSLGAKSIKRTFSDGTKFATVSGDILSGRLYWLLYDGTDYLILNAAGRVGWSLQDTAIDVASSSNVYADFDYTTKDTHDFHPGDYNTEVKIPPGLAGTYILTASIVYAPMAEGSSFILRVYKSGALLDNNAHDCIGDAGTGSSYYSLTYAITTTLAAGDVLKLYAWQDSGSTLNGCFCSFEGSRICD